MTSFTVEWFLGDIKALKLLVVKVILFHSAENMVLFIDIYFSFVSGSTEYKNCSSSPLNEIFDWVVCCAFTVLYIIV